MRVAHYAIRTEEAYVDWIRRFILYHNKRHPSEMGAAEITEFLTHLAVEGKVAASTQNQALSGLLYLYQQVLKIELPLINAVRATAPVRLPVVLSVMEVRRLLAAVPDGTYRLMIELMYGSGLRLLESCRLRVKDIDFERQQILVREGKGDKDRAVPLPERLSDRLQKQIGKNGDRHLRRSQSPFFLVESTPSPGSRRRKWASLVASCFGREIPECGTRVDLAIRISVCAAQSGPARTGRTGTGTADGASPRSSASAPRS